MNSVHLSLPDPLGAFVDQQARQYGHASGSDYVRELICREQERQRLRDALLAGAASGPGSIADAGYFAALRSRVDDAGK